MGILRLPAQTHVHEGVHADSSGASRYHMWEPTGKVLHSGEFGLDHFWLCRFVSYICSTGTACVCMQI